MRDLHQAQVEQQLLANLFDEEIELGTEIIPGNVERTPAPWHCECGCAEQN